MDLNRADTVIKPQWTEGPACLVSGVHSPHCGGVAVDTCLPDIAAPCDRNADGVLLEFSVPTGLRKSDLARPLQSRSRLALAHAMTRPDHAPNHSNHPGGNGPACGSIAFSHPCPHTSSSGLSEAGAGVAIHPDIQVNAVATCANAHFPRARQAVSTRHGLAGRGHQAVDCRARSPGLTITSWCLDCAVSVHTFCQPWGNAPTGHRAQAAIAHHAILEAASDATEIAW